MGKTITEVYKRYLDSLKNENADIAINLISMRDWANENIDEPQLRESLKLDALYHALKALNERKEICRQKAGSNWDKDAVQKLYERLKNLDRAAKSYYVSETGVDEKKKLVIIATALNSFIESFKEKSPWLYLYMWHAYSNSYAGQWLRDNADMNREHQQLIDSLIPSHSNA